ncbi:cation-translocating P-type ATPase [Clostridium sp.]|uniref:cation-translocating P-type ATPase n=1 Tax=Clostridium sp. TaxID=1506 RepID=UPI0025F5FB0C|nr:cation-translocating P-type ATPase [uncultured Clostridium sp.]MDU4882449.1 cation-translocating P-type ATPase [Clostridium celatum]MDU7075845.1 cation-translocating P-type ATPase [Clostridium celatum]
MEEQRTILGLTEAEVLERKEKGQINIIEEKTVKSNWEIIAGNVFTLFNLYNFLIAIALMSVGAYSNLAFILIIILNISIGSFQEIHAKNMVAKLSVLTVSKVDVIRDGREKSINVDEVVLDDITILNMGNQISSDSVVIDGKIEVNESLLTGESDTIVKMPGDKLFSGSYVVSGKCYAKVEKVGKDNLAAEITLKSKKHKKVNSELLNSMRKVTRLTSFIIIPVGVLLFVQAFFFRDQVIKSSVVTTAAALLGMLPKGLVLLISISLATGVIKLAKKKVLVQDLYSVETLAHVDTLCLDKTGTITEGKMKVSNVEIFNEEIMPISIEQALSAFVNEIGDNNGTFQALKEHFNGNDNFDVDYKNQFSSERKWSSISFKGIGSIIVGAPERLIAKSAFEMKENMIEAQKQGKRVLLVGFSKDVVEDTLPEIEIIAAIELSDPLRKNAKEMLGFFKGEGVTVKIISGDNPLTVSSIAKQAGLDEYESYIDLSTIKNDDEIIDLVDKYSIFARVSPNQKSLLVQALQAKGHTVAMTGDGVNDVIALRQADCSITLPEASDVAKQVSQIVLLNSDFSVLKDVLMEGRRVVNNITNVATIFFIKTLYSVMLSILNIITCTAFPFMPIQITLVDLAIEGYTSFFISFEPNGKQIKEKFLKSVLKNSFPYSVVIIINIICLYFLAPAVGIAEAKMTTLMYYMIGFTSILAVVRVCRPFNKMRVFLCTTTAIGFFVATILFRNLLHLSKLGIQELTVFLIMAILSTILILIKNYLMKVKY